MFLKSHRLKGAIFIAILSTGFAHAEMMIDYPQGGVVLKNGWSTLENRKTPQVCIEGDSITDPGETTDVDFSDVTDTSSLMDAFSVSASAKVSAIGGGGSASAKFSKETKLSSTGTNVAVRVLTLRGATYVVPAGMAPAVQAALLAQRKSVGIAAKPTLNDLNLNSIHLTARALQWAQTDPWRFRLECGDSYVAATIPATGLNGIVAAETHESSERTAIEATVSGSYGPASGNISASQTVLKMASENKLHIAYHQIGGPGYAVSTSIDSFLDLVKQIGPNAPPIAGTPNLIEVRPYTELADYTVAPDFSVITSMVNEFFRLYTLRDIDADVISNPSSYKFGQFVTLDSVALIGSKINSDMALLYTAIQACSKSLSRRAATSCVFPANVPETDYIYRAHMPLKMVDAAPFASRQSEYQALGRLNKQLSQTPRTVSVYVCTFQGPTSCWNGHYEQVSNPVYRNIVGQINRLESQISAEPEVFDDEELRFKLYVAYPAYKRCSDHVENNGCIVGSELNDYRETVHTLYK